MPTSVSISIERFFCELLVRAGRVQKHDFIQLVADGEQRIEAGHRLLEDHGDLLAADALHGARGHLGNVVDLVHRLERGESVAVLRLHQAVERLALLVEHGSALFIERGLRFDDLLTLFHDEGLLRKPHEGKPALVEQGLAVFIEQRLILCRRCARFLIHPDGNGLVVLAASVVLRGKADGTAHDLPLRRLHQLHDGQGRDRLAAARFADDADDGLFWNFERYPVHRFGDARIREEIGAQIFDLENIVLVLHLRQILFFRHMAALFPFVFARGLEVLARDAARLLTRNVVRIVLVRDVLVPFFGALRLRRKPALYARRKLLRLLFRLFLFLLFLFVCHAVTSSSWDRARPADRRR